MIKLKEVWNWAAEFARADKETQHVGKKKSAPSDASGDHEGRFNPKVDGHYNVMPDRNVMSPGEVQHRAETYMSQYGSAGYKVDNVNRNADGSFAFTTTKGGKVKHHTFHKTGGHSQVTGGDVVIPDHEVTVPDVEEKPSKSKQTDFTALYKALGIRHTAPNVRGPATGVKEKELKKIKGGGTVTLGNVTMHRKPGDSDSV